MMTPERHKEIWDKLKEYSAQGDLLEYYTLYKTFLEEGNIISDSRRAIYEATLQTISLLKGLINE